jgi:hypothetical protein
MTRKSTPSPAAKSGQTRRTGARVLDSARHDPYAPKGKYKAMCCSTCGAVYQAGRWQWSATSAPLGTCPACRRIADRMPAGRLTLDGPYAMEHQAELLRLARHEADAERADHPMHRIMNVEMRPDAIDITTTDIHLPRRIGEALRRAHDGRLTMAYGEDAYEVRVDWRR